MGLHRKISGASTSVLNLLSSKGDHHNGASSPPRAQQHAAGRHAVSDTEVFREDTSSPDTLVEIPLDAEIHSAAQGQALPKRPSAFRRWSSKPSAKAERMKLEEVIQKLEADNRQLRAKNDAHLDDIARLEKECETMQRQMESLSQTIQDFVEARGQSAQRIEELQMDNTRLENMVQEQSNTYFTMLQELEESETKVQQQADTLIRLNRELDAVQPLLGEGDKHSEEAVMDMINALNANINQTSAQIVDSFEYRDVKQVEPKGLQQACLHARHYIGQNMVDILRTTNHCANPVLVQIAVQACLALFVKWMITSWLFDSTPSETSLTDLWNKVEEEEPPLVARRWHSITRTNVRRMTGVKEVEPRLTSHIALALVDVLVTAGCKTVNLRDSLTRSFVTPLSIIVDQALSLNTAINQEITSSHYKVVLETAGQPFDPRTMIDYATYSEEEKIPQFSLGERVMCTTDLGLRRCSIDARNKNEEGAGTPLVLPKVALDTLMRGMRQGQF